MADSLLFYALAALLLVSAALAVTVKNIFHAALHLAVALLAVAALYVTLGAYFLAAVQVLIYIGAVVVLAIFVINLTRTAVGAPVRLTRRWVIPGAIVSLLAACLIIVALLKSAGPAGGAMSAAALKAPLSQAGAEDLGRHLLGDYVLPFELVSVLLLAALIAAIVIVAKDREGER
jgi:NADH-quinone oxidoreductase subunit J